MGRLNLEGSRSLEGLVESGAGPIGIDSAIFNYWAEDHPRYAPILVPLFEAIDCGEIAAHTSGITLLEVLVRPLREGDLGLADRYQQILTQSRGLTMRELDTALLRAAAQPRAATAVRTPSNSRPPSPPVAAPSSPTTVACPRLARTEDPSACRDALTEACDESATYFIPSDISSRRTDGSGAKLATV
ncbi:MAG: hypothetical protein K8J08_03280 [Thermoanaerobaculia bacterium]|nr:hypothetical protein [Thermoanaerobaculia bacterium]